MEAGSTYLQWCKLETSSWWEAIHLIIYHVHKTNFKRIDCKIPKSKHKNEWKMASYLTFWNIDGNACLDPPRILVHRNLEQWNNLDPWSFRVRQFCGQKIKMTTRMHIRPTKDISGLLEFAKGRRPSETTSSWWQAETQFTIKNGHRHEVRRIEEGSLPQ